MLFYYLLFLLILISLFAANLFKSSYPYFFASLAVLLIIVAGFRQIGVDSDSATYADIFNTIGYPIEYFKDYYSNSILEPAYYLIPSVFITYLKLSSVLVFLLFAVIGISLKFVAISKLTDFVLLSVLVYFSHFFILHDMTQIRSGVASGLLLLCIIEIQKRNFAKFVLLIGVGFLFHYSMIIFLPFYFLNSKKINKKAYLSVLFVPYLLHFFKINIITLLQTFKLGIISDKIQFYNDLLDLGIFTEINIYNVMFTIQVCSCALFIIKNDLLIKNNKYSILLLKIYCIATASFVLFYNVPVLAFRISELLSVVQIIIMPFMLYIFKPRFNAILGVILFALLFLSVDILYLGLLKPYFSNANLLN